MSRDHGIALDVSQLAEPLTIVIAPDSFKGSASAIEVAAWLARGWHEVRPMDDVIELPLADGGEGTLEVFARSNPAAKRMPVDVSGPDNTAVAAEWLLLPGEARHGPTGLVELANTSGITLLDTLRPLDAHTLGFGEAIRAALDFPVERLVLAVGGSASTDGGVAALMALGAQFLNAQGVSVSLGGRGLGNLDRVVSALLRPPPVGGAVVLTDVTNPLLGPRGAAAVFGPQKGATRRDVDELESALVRLAEKLYGTETHADEEGSVLGTGAGGGTSFGLRWWGAELQNGAQIAGDLMGLDKALQRADVVVTGEGQYDSQSQSGKLPAHVLDMARRADVRACLVAGSIAVRSEMFDRTVSLESLAPDAASSLRTPEPFIEEAGRHLARWISVGAPGGWPRDLQATP